MLENLVLTIITMLFTCFEQKPTAGYKDCQGRVFQLTEINVIFSVLRVTRGEARQVLK